MVSYQGREPQTVRRRMSADLEKIYDSIQISGSRGLYEDVWSDISKHIRELDDHNKSCCRFDRRV